MRLNKTSSDSLFGTQNRTILDLWNQMQRLQTEFALGQELGFYYTSSQWHAANTVLDVGTGNGYYLNKIANRFPEKTYHGIDISAELIAIAEREAESEELTFTHCSIFDIEETYDFVLMRLLIQHMEDIEASLKRVAALTKPGGSAFIIDAHDRERFFHPAVPEFIEFFSAYAQKERDSGRDREVKCRVDKVLALSDLWRIGRTVHLVIPSTICGNLDLFTKTYCYLVDLVEQAGGLECDFSAVRKALLRWSQSRSAYAQVGLTLMRIDRV